jgi:hypothetical protein
MTRLVRYCRSMQDDKDWRARSSEIRSCRGGIRHAGALVATAWLAARLVPKRGLV